MSGAISSPAWTRRRLTGAMASSDPQTDPRLLVLAPGDNIAVARLEVAADTILTVAGRPVRLPRGLGFGHKIAARTIRDDRKRVVKGKTRSCSVDPGDHRNLKKNNKKTKTVI